MMTPSTSWEKLVKHVRSPLGFLSAVLVIIAGVVIAILYGPIPVMAKYIVVGTFLVTAIVIIIWVIKRTPRTPSGLVATEDYYALTAYLEHCKVYGTESKTGTRREMLTKRRIAGNTALQSPRRPELSKGENH